MAVVTLERECSGELPPVFHHVAVSKWAASKWKLKSSTPSFASDSTVSEVMRSISIPDDELSNLCEEIPRNLSTPEDEFSNGVDAEFALPDAANGDHVDAPVADELTRERDWLAKEIIDTSERTRAEAEALSKMEEREKENLERIRRLEAMIAAQEKQLAQASATSAGLMQSLRDQHTEKVDMLFSRMNEIDEMRRQERATKAGGAPRSWLFLRCF